MIFSIRRFSKTLFPFIFLGLELSLSFGCSQRAKPQRQDGATSATDAASQSARPASLNPISAAKTEANYIKEHYTKTEHMVAMRDGIKLFTNVYTPKDRSHPYPILMTRTPYSVQPYGVDKFPDGSSMRVMARFAPSFELVKEGYIFVHQDVRGCLMSEGKFVDVRPLQTQPTSSEIDESTDAYDTIDWLVKNVTGNNGSVGIWGISYPGFYSAQAAVRAHPALKAVSPQAPVTDWFVGDDFHHNGAFFLEDAFSFYANFGRPRPKPVKDRPWDFAYPTPDRYDFFRTLGPLSNANKNFLKGEIEFWNDLTKHGTRDSFWQKRNPLHHYHHIKPAVLVVGGWFDAEDLWGTIATYRAMDVKSPGGSISLVMGPWNHGGWARSDGDLLGDVRFGEKTSLWYRSHVELEFFNRYLKGKTGPAIAEATMFETGSNQWRTYAVWPPKEAKQETLYLHDKGRLSGKPPSADEIDSDDYLSDPKAPVPSSGLIGKEHAHDYMFADQRFSANRPDVLVFSTEILKEDVVLTGPLVANLQIASTGTDADFVVKLIDVYPNNQAAPVPNPKGVVMGGYQQMVRAEVMRSKFRDSLDNPTPLKPNEVTAIRFSMPDVNHAFQKGHKIMVHIQSSWFPLIDRNPQRFVDIYSAKEEDFQRATQTIFHGPAHTSSLTVSLLKGKLPN
jgi:uncharacterized protein